MTGLTTISLNNGSIGQITSDLKPLLEKDFSAGNDILLMHYIQYHESAPDELAKYKRKILIQPMDGNVLRPVWRDRMNQFDMIVTHSEAGANILKGNGINVPISVIPLYTNDTTCAAPEKVTFYHESNQNPTRKGIDLIVKGFEAAGLNAGLIMKVAKGTKINGKNITVIDDYQKDLKSLWAQCSIYIGLSRMEGFGLPLLRFLGYGRKIIVLENELAGYNDFLKGRDGVFFVPSIRVKNSNTYNSNCLFASNDNSYVDADINTVAKVIRQAYKSTKVIAPLPKNFYEKYSIGNFYSQLKKIL